jgi:hypothetical protein
MSSIFSLVPLLAALHFAASGSAEPLSDNRFRWIADGAVWRNCTVPVVMTILPAADPRKPTFSAQFLGPDGETLRVRRMSSLSAPDGGVIAPDRIIVGADNTTGSTSIVLVDGFRTCGGTVAGSSGISTVSATVAGALRFGPFNVTLLSVPTAVREAAVPATFSYEASIGGGYTPCNPFFRKYYAKDDGQTVVFGSDISECSSSDSLGDSPPKPTRSTIERRMTSSDAKAAGAPWHKPLFTATAPTWTSILVRANPETAMICDCGDSQVEISVTWSSSSSLASFAGKSEFHCGCGLAADTSIIVPSPGVSDVQAAVEKWIIDNDGVVKSGAASLLSGCGGAVVVSVILAFTSLVLL